MKITPKKVTMAELVNGYEDKGNDGVFAYGGKLSVRPPFQREYVYGDDKRDEVIRTILDDCPVNDMYWMKKSDGTYELIDGQQRTISICEFLKSSYSVDDLYYHNLTEGDTKNTIDNYNLEIYECEGTPEEELKWFQKMNNHGEPATYQEMLNGSYSGKWLSHARLYFAKNNCQAIREGYITGVPKHQELLEQVLSWAADKEGVDTVQAYMAKHQHDKDASELIKYYEDVMKWAVKYFPEPIKKITDHVEWGRLYNMYKTHSYDPKQLAADVKTLSMDDDVKDAGIVEYLLSHKTNEKVLNIRSFTDKQKRRKYDEQGGKCKLCNQMFTFAEMEGDHKKPWSEGGKTEYDNLQMLCRQCNRTKSNK